MAKANMNAPQTVAEVRDYIQLALPFLEALARRTSNKGDDLAVAILQLVNSNDEIAQMVVDALGNGGKLPAV